jgi:hypothetical protein
LIYVIKVFINLVECKYIIVSNSRTQNYIDNRGKAIRSQTTITQSKCTQIKKKTTDGFGYLKQVVMATVVVQSSEGPEIFLLLFIYLMCRVMNGLFGCDDLYEF